MRGSCDLSLHGCGCGIGLSSVQKRPHESQMFLFSEIVGGRKGLLFVSEGVWQMEYPSSVRKRPYDSCVFLRHGWDIIRDKFLKIINQ